MLPSFENSSFHGRNLGFYVNIHVCLFLVDTHDVLIHTLSSYEPVIMPRQKGVISNHVNPYKVRIAELYFQKRLTQNEAKNALEDETSLKFTRTEIANVIEEWESSGRVRIELLPEQKADDEESEDKHIISLQEQLMLRFDLTDCRLVPGILNSESDYTSGSQSSQWRVLAELGDAGGTYLSEILPRLFRRQTKEPATLCVGPGRAINFAIGQIELKSNLKVQPHVVPMTGFLGWRRVGTSPMANARRLERVLGNAYLYWYPTPAIIPGTVKAHPDYNAKTLEDHLKMLPVVQKTDEIRRRADIYIFSTGSAPRLQEWCKDWNLVDEDVADNYAKVIKNLSPKERPVGAISGMVFNRNGQEIGNLPWITMGATLEELRVAVAEGGREVILIAGGDEQRVEAIYALAHSKTINVLITDVRTARFLLAHST